VTVGLDIGSSTSHLMFSKIYLQLVGETPDVRAVIVAREILYQSPIWLTPYLPDNTIDMMALDEYFAEAYDAVQATREHIDTGAIVLTGEALKRSNARTIASLFAREAGQFVCASAGHHMEAVLAANGSGTVAWSRRDRRTLLNVDIGGGTTKLALVRDGHVIATAAVAVGARVVARDEDGRLTRIDGPAEIVADELGITLTLGEPLALADEQRIVQAWTEVLVGLVQRKPPAGLAAKLMLTDPLPAELVPQAMTFSGGVSEYIFQREDRDFGDLGKSFAKALRNAINRKQFGLPAIIDPNLGIRATAVGASQFDVQGGVNAYISDEAILPLLNVPVLAPGFELGEETPPDHVAAAIRESLARANLTDGEQPVALSFAVGPSDLPDGLVRTLAGGLRMALPATLSGAAALVIVVNQGTANRFVTPEQDFYVFKEQRPASRLGQLLREEMGAVCPLVAMEGVRLAEFDFIDVGRQMHPSEVVPVTVKSLLFAGGMDRRSVKQALIDAALGK
jgi:ethanolamine utilization protein EutA